jgi:hypothetical protein
VIKPVQARHAVFIDPPSEHYLKDRLFDLSDKHLNRDDTLLPFARLRDTLRQQGVAVRTADYLKSEEGSSLLKHYWSIGILNGYKALIGRHDVRLRGFVLAEPPLVAPKMYRALPELTRVFEEVYVHNTVGDGYSLNGVITSKLRKLYWPLPYDHVVEPFWSRSDRLNKLVNITGNHNPRFRRPEFYSKRIEAMAALSEFDAVDLYGRGWDRWWSRQSMWLPYWKFRRQLMSIHKGPCDSKLETLSQYRFCLCLENTPMKGWLTEKLFDCLYSGTVPVYWGAPDIETLVPPEAYVDFREYTNWDDVWSHIRGMSNSEWRRMRDVGRDFVIGGGMQKYYNALSQIVRV